MALIADYDFVNRSIIISFNPQVVKDAKETCPEIVTGFIYGNTNTVFKNPFSTVKEINADILWAHHLMIAPFLDKNKQRIPVCIWTVNYKIDTHSLDQNIIGIVSDDLQTAFGLKQTDPI